MSQILLYYKKKVVFDFLVSFNFSYIWCISHQYHKQTQLEAMASEKAAMEFQLEKELKRFQEAQVCI